jgi:hypothetical protein
LRTRGSTLFQNETIKTSISRHQEMAPFSLTLLLRTETLTIHYRQMDKKTDQPLLSRLFLLRSLRTETLTSHHRHNRSQMDKRTDQPLIARLFFLRLLRTRTLTIHHRRNRSQMDQEKAQLFTVPIRMETLAKL